MAAIAAARRTGRRGGDHRRPAMAEGLGTQQRGGEECDAAAGRAEGGGGGRGRGAPPVCPPLAAAGGGGKARSPTPSPSPHPSSLCPQMSNLVLTAEQRTATGREPDGSAESLWGKMPGRMGDRVRFARPEGLAPPKPSAKKKARGPGETGEPGEFDLPKKRRVSQQGARSGAVGVGEVAGGAAAARAAPPPLPLLHGSAARRPCHRSCTPARPRPPRAVPPARAGGRCRLCAGH